MKRRNAWSWRLLLLPLLLVGWLFVIFGFSSQPYQKQDIKPKLQRWIPQETAERIVPNISFKYHHGTVSGANPYGFIEFFVRKGAHLFEYGVLGVLCFLLLFPIPKTGWRFLGALALTAAAALTDEWYQSRVSNRTSTLLDVGVDLTGAILAICLFLLAYRLLWGRIGKKSNR
ncbi:VanZ family protein [Cohnella thailandensis]|uniref:VanZ family protein n=1 Tax=Cohnella thailandensis TaxID=557557 RepID=A0A841T8I5_9BACL|nr:VanZ family protein [Cohnella thailandensis]MBB6638167.1 VanZ family protein [Cohnella thailandensis]MBP1971908.1 VanZ family protein [Cohnella thailandensis]